MPILSCNLLNRYARGPGSLRCPVLTAVTKYSSRARIAQSFYGFLQYLCVGTAFFDDLHILLLYDFVDRQFTPFSLLPYAFHNTLVLSPMLHPVSRLWKPQHLCFR